MVRVCFACGVMESNKVSLLRVPNAEEQRKVFVKTLDSIAQIAIRQARVLQVFICDGHQVKADVENECIYDEDLAVATNVEFQTPKTESNRFKEQMEVEVETDPLVDHDYCLTNNRSAHELLPHFRSREMQRDLRPWRSDLRVMARALSLQQLVDSPSKQDAAVSSG